MKLNVIIPTWDLKKAERTKAAFEWWGSSDLDVTIINAPDTSAVDNMITGGEMPGDILAFIHDDVEILEEHWDLGVLKFFEAHPKCGMVGFGGALGLGTDRLYKDKYDFHQLARITYMSNAIDAEDHGLRVTEPRQVMVLDGFSQIIRRDAYTAVGGWKAVKAMGLSFHMYDAAMACMMAEKEWEVWMLPFVCLHHGGGTSVSKQYDSWLRKNGIQGDQQIHTEAHKVIYRRFKSVLPLRLGVNDGIK
jgi:hypothetical protein